ncbi:MAG: glycosyltransferase [Candidatus Omnitrophica bacterium]|nr:glycosyltransferase [Candidatus Omnitrophota bacterium]MCM8826693.1 glycosyltransferase [Candidatus Omnitrophota bacterium]
MKYEDFTIILPSLNEVNNIGNLIDNLINYYPGISIIVCDDGSTDGTREAILSFLGKVKFLDRRSRSTHGLTISVLEASNMVNSKYFIVMDADGQHPFDKVRDIMFILEAGADLAIACREQLFCLPIFKRFLSYTGNFFGWISLLSRGKNYLFYDILSGFFGVKTRLWKEFIFENNNLNSFRLKGYKILFDFLKIVPSYISTRKVLYRIKDRYNGSSKVNKNIYWEYIKALIF